MPSLVAGVCRCSPLNGCNEWIDTWSTTEGNPDTFRAGCLPSTVDKWLRFGAAYTSVTIERSSGGEGKDVQHDLCMHLCTWVSELPEQRPPNARPLDAWCMYRVSSVFKPQRSQFGLYHRPQFDHTCQRSVFSRVQVRVSPTLTKVGRTTPQSLHCVGPGSPIPSLAAPAWSLEPVRLARR